MKSSKTWKLTRKYLCYKIWLYADLCSFMKKKLKVSTKYENNDVVFILTFYQYGIQQNKIT